MLKNTIRTMAVLGSGIVVGAVLLILVYMIPISEESANAVTSMEILNTEGWYPVVPLMNAFDGEVSGLSNGGILDNFTDSIMISTAAAETGGRPWYQAMKMWNSVMEKGYAYYWHGYVTLLRPLLLFLHYGEIRVLNEMLQMLMVFALFCLVKRRKGIVWAILSLTVYGLLFPMALACSLQYSWVFYIMTSVSIVMFLFEDRWRKNNNIFFLFLISGMLTSYFDLLTYPLVTWGIPMVWWIVLDKEENSEISRLSTVVSNGLFWILGYGGMWAGKWILGQLLLREEIAVTAWNEVMYRAGMQAGSEGSDVSHWENISINLAQCNNIPYLFMLGAWLLWMIYRMVKGRGAIRPVKTLAFALIAASAFVWYIVLHNHTFVHSSFTYRIFTIFFVAVLAGFVTSVETENGKSVKEGKIHGILQRGIPVGILVLSIVLVLLEREERLQHNGNVVSNQIRLEEGQRIIQDFVPTHNEIKTLYLGISTEGEPKGHFVVEIYRGEEVLLKREISAADVAGSGFYGIPVDIKLKKGMPYSIQFYWSGKDDCAGWISVTPEGNYALSEFSRVVLDEQEYDLQMIGGFVYNAQPEKSKLALDFIVAVWLAGTIYLGGICGYDLLRQQRRSVYK